MQDDIEYEYKYTEGFLDEQQFTKKLNMRFQMVVYSRIGNIEDNPNYDLLKINPRDR